MKKLNHKKALINTDKIKTNLQSVAARFPAEL